MFITLYMYMRSRVMHLIASVCVCMYVCLYIYVCILCDQKIDLFSVLPFEKFLLSVLYYLILEFKCLQSGFLHPASCTDEAIRVRSI